MTHEVEIERKWLMSEATGKSLLLDRYATVITQAYFGHACRIRMIVEVDSGVKAEITVKLSTSALSRNEYNYPIPTGDAVEMLKSLATIRKHRFVLDNGFTLDVFKEELSGLYILEKEYESEEAANIDELPYDWEAIDVSGTSTFVNSNLSGKRWDPVIGLITDPGPVMKQYGGDPFPPNVEFQLITGDEEDYMPPALIIP